MYVQRYPRLASKRAKQLIVVKCLSIIEERGEICLSRLLISLVAFESIGFRYKLLSSVLQP